MSLPLDDDDDVLRPIVPDVLVVSMINGSLNDCC